MSEKFFVGLDVTGFQDNGTYKPISRVTLLLDDENAVTAGDDAGMELTADCPHATQAMADRILAAVKGYQYRAYGADAANLDPAAELGDGVNVGGLYSVVSRIADDGGGFSGISATGEREMEEEYPAAGPMTQAFDRKLAATRSQIKKTAEEILLEVAATDGRVSELKVSLDGVVSRVQGLEGDVSSIEQKVDSITLSVSNGSTSSTIKLLAGGVEVASQTISMSGLVTFSGLSGGTTTIDGACIRTGTIDADRLNLTGAITFGDLSMSVQNDINDAYSMASDAQSLAGSVDSVVNGWTYRGTTYIDGEMLMTGTVRASSLEGGRVMLLNANEDVVGIMSMTGSTTSNYAVDIRSYGALRLTANGGYAFLQSEDGAFVQCGGGMISFGDDIGPAGSGNISCGTSAHKWSSVYTVSGVIQTSDRTKKHDISYDLQKYDALFDLLAPASYKLDEGSSGRTHVGMVAQDVEAALEAAGISPVDFGGFIKMPREGGGDEYALRYDEFIPLCVRQIKMLKERLERSEGQHGS